MFLTSHMFNRPVLQSFQMIGSDLECVLHAIGKLQEHCLQQVSMDKYRELFVCMAMSKLSGSEYTRQLESVWMHWAQDAFYMICQHTREHSMRYRTQNVKLAASPQGVITVCAVPTRMCRLTATRAFEASWYQA